MMKLLTLNTHSLQEEHYPDKLAAFVDTVLQEQPDLIAMQEVNQTVSAPVLETVCLQGFISVMGTDIPLRLDNHAAAVARRLCGAGVRCSWTWLPIKLGYGKYDEGVALFRLHGQITGIDAFQISRSGDYHNWRTRKVLGVRIDGRDDWFYTVHMGWWNDEEEPFRAQCDRLEQRLAEQKSRAAVWLLGDFNSPAEVPGQGYDCIRNAGWQDTYLLAEEKDSGMTVAGAIDGWRDERNRPSHASGMRIDYIWCSRRVPIQRSAVIFNGKNGPVVSDHFGIIVETRDSEKGTIVS